MTDYFETDDVVKEYDSVIFKRIVSYLKPYRGQSIIVLVSLLLSTFGELVLPIVQQRLLDDVILNTRQKSIELIGKYILLMLIILCAVFACNFLSTWFTQLVSQNVMRDIRLSLFDNTVRQSTAFLSRHPVGRIVTRLTGDVETINEFFTSVISAFLKDLTVMAGVVVTLFYLSFKLALVVMAALPPVLIITFICRKKARDAFRQQRTASSAVNSFLSEHLRGREVVQLAGGEKRAANTFDERNNNLFRANLREMYVQATFRPAIELLATITTALAIVVGANMSLGGNVSLGVLIAFITLISMFFSPVIDIAEKYTIMQSAMAGGERVFSLLDTKEFIPDTGVHQYKRDEHDELDTINNKTIHPDYTNPLIKGDVEFDNVHFSYKQGEEVLKGLNFKVKAGSKAAITGYTGAGKTTISNLLRRLWDIDAGSIKVDGVDIRDVPLALLRRQILPVLQDVFLFSMSIADNIRLGEELSIDEVKRAAKAVCADSFIEALPDGYETILSEGAANLSQGQRQLLSFARVIAHNPSIVVLDEATSSIDSETERLVQEGISALLKGRTSLVIAHRLSTVADAEITVRL
jgi:ATP-binding cassette subfamily B protein